MGFYGLDVLVEAFFKNLYFCNPWMDYFDPWTAV